MKDKTLLEIFNASDEVLADFMREAIESYYSMDLDKHQIGVVVTESLKDAYIIISISGDVDD